MKFGEDMFQIILFLLHIILAECFTPSNTKLYKVLNCMILDQLTINPKKRITILVIQPTLRGTPVQFLLNIDEVCVKSTANVKYLGLNLDQLLN